MMVYKGSSQLDEFKGFEELWGELTVIVNEYPKPAAESATCHASWM